MNYKLEIILFGHILNPLWKSHAERRRIRGEVTRRAVDRRLDSYLDFIRDLRPESQPKPCVPETERIFSIWFQGEDAAPELVKACWRSVRKNCPQELVVLDSSNIFQWIDLPEHIVRKWREGGFRPAHFADICRLALLERYGGLWLDATDFVPAPLPDSLWQNDFFVYMSGRTQTGWYSFIQNCFIRAKAGNFLISAWLRLIYEYWSREDKPLDYFIHQLLFKKLVENNDCAAKLFSAMPKIDQDATHTIWFGSGAEEYRKEDWDALTAAAMFQKTEYKSALAKSPQPLSNAWHLIHSNLPDSAA